MKLISLLAVLLILLGQSGFCQDKTSTPASGVWLTIQNKADLPLKDVKGGIKSQNSKLNEILKKYKISEFSYPLSNAKTLNLKKVIELRCKSCSPQILKKDLESKGFGSRKFPVEIAPEYKELFTPNDYSLTFTAGDYALDLINAKCAWDITTGDPSIIIGISDSNYYADPNNGGIHEELTGKFVVYDTTNTSNRNHGTAVATIAAGLTHNNIGKSSIGYNCRLALYRMNYNEVLAAATAGIKVINMSWTSGCNYNSYAEQAINDAYNMGSFLIAAAGNGTTCGGPSNLVYPAAYDNVFAVTSVGPNNNHEQTPGNPNTTHQHYSQVDLSSPGYDVGVTSGPNWYYFSSGTSFAAPYVAGTVGLMLTVNPNLTPVQIKSILQSTSFNIDNLNPSYAGLIGAGRLNACAAVAAAQGTSPLNATINVNSACNQNEIVADLEVTGGVSPYSFNWSNGSTTEDLTGAAPGVYSVTITDSNGQTNSQAVTIPTITPMTITQNLTMPGSGNSGAIDISVTPSGSYTYQWSNGATTQDISNLAPGSYSVTVTNSNGCSAQASFKLFSPLVANLSVQQGCVKNGGSLDLSVAGGIPPYSYQWSNGTTTQDLNYLLAGTYTVIVTDQGGNTTSSSGIINAFQATTVTGQVTSSSNGTNGAIDLNVTGPGPFTYSWSNGATTEDISGLASGTYSVTVTNVNGCREVRNFVVPSAFTLSGNTGFGCSKISGYVDLSVNGGMSPLTYSWSNGSTTQDVSNLPAGSYTVNVTDATGLTATASFNVPAYSALTITGLVTHVTGNQNNGAINATISGQVAQSYSWSNSAGNFIASTEDINNLAPGNYYLSVVSKNGCKNNKSFTVLKKLKPSGTESIKKL
jgi:hypothetical protein